FLFSTICQVFQWFSGKKFIKLLDIILHALHVWSILGEKMHPKSTPYFAIFFIRCYNNMAWTTLMILG
ncbi:hypothetical protein, partial [Streptococcus acidominimus]|uniref:hypothetical protein n=1 Tax=Streptococcus acidominimus TaxID=1326 RepID=UPI001ADD8463